MPNREIRASRLFNVILRYTFGKYLKCLFNVDFEDEDGIRELKPPYVLLANHTNTWDPFMIAAYIPHPVYYVTSDAYFRNFFVKQLLRLVGAIPKTKSVSDSDTVKSIIRVRNRDGIIGIFPEGKRNWDGKTLPLLYPTAKLIKSLKVPVVTSLLQGAYLSKPRWSKKHRKGKLTITYKMILNPGEIKTMSADDIFKTICDSLSFDEYDVQEKLMTPYRGKKLAENLELYLFICPQCHAIGGMRSHGDTFSCTSCNYTVRYDEYGFLRKASDRFYFSKPGEWDKWQCAHLGSVLLESRTEESSKPLFSDSNVILKKGGRLIPLKKFRFGHIDLLNNKILFTSRLGEKFAFEADRISGINVQRNNRFEFYYGKTLYTFAFKRRKTSAYKWVEAVQLIKAESKETLL